MLCVHISHDKQSLRCVCTLFGTCTLTLKYRLPGSRWALYPPEPHKLREVYHLGYRDALHWLRENGRIPYGAPSAWPMTNCL